MKTTVFQATLKQSHFDVCAERGVRRGNRTILFLAEQTVAID